MSQVKLIVILSLFIFVNCISSVYGSDFRGLKWGATADELKGREKVKPVSDKANFIMYRDKIGSVNVYVIYNLKYGKLCSGSYSNITKHANKNDYIDDYDSFKELMTKKYGKPNEDIVRWKNDLYKDSPQDYGMAVSLGHLALESHWITDNTIIVNALSGDNYKLYHDVDYLNVHDIEENAERYEREKLDKL